jgi:hypothetical protein
MADLCTSCRQPIPGQTRTVAACHWHRAEDGTTTLIPGCWPRIHDPDAECLCGRWSEGTAREIIKGLRNTIYRMGGDIQRMRLALHAAGLPDHARIFDPKAHTARQRRRAMHKAITEAGGDNG